MRLVLKILGLLGLIILGVVGIAGLQSPEFKVERSRSINAPVETIFTWVGDLKKWRDWSPWVEMDPTVVINYSGPEMGVGSKYEWKGPKSGSGFMEITEFQAPQGVKLTIHFNDWNATNNVELSLAPSPSGTLVTWTMEGKNNLIGRIFWNIFGFKKAIDKDFDRGLELLEQKVKAAQP